MTWKSVPNFLANGFLLLIPVFLWNVVLATRLPEPYQVNNFWHNIPRWIGITENIFRGVVFFLPLFLKLGFKTPQQKLGWSLYLLGLGIYFASWLLQIYFPASSWSRSAAGFLAPAYTSVIWLFGIGLIGKEFFFKIPYHYSVYLSLAAGFGLVHSLHAYLIYLRI